MPGLAVSVNGKEIVTVSTEGYNLLAVRVSGDLISEEFATLDMSGGLYGEGENNKHLTWINLIPLKPGDEVAVRFLVEATTSHPGRTIDELYPEGERMGPWQPLEKMFEDLATEPKVRERFTFVLTAPGAESLRAATTLEDHSFGFSVTWAWNYPQRARVSLSSASLTNIAKRESGTDHAGFKLEPGQGVTLRVDV
jgi:hypothetical protein